jgi:putative ABC transport system substrate-binding protein
MMKRREFITLLGGTAAIWPLAARAQSTMPVIGFLNGASPGGFAPMVTAFLGGLKEAGYAEGQNVAIEYRWAEGKYDQLPALAADLIRRHVSVIAATGTPANLMAKNATAEIPIVFTTGSDPVALGLVDSLNRPGGNVTGVTQLTGEVAPKRVELAHEMFPAAKIIALLVNPTNPTAETLTTASRAAAATLGLQIEVLKASTEAEVDDAFAAVPQKRAAALVICADAFFNSNPELLAAQALRHSVPAIYEFRRFAAAGGLMSYGGSILDSYRLAGVYIGRILKGEKPAEMPVQQSTKVELIVNLKTSKALGLTVPISLLGRADEVIE